jgi:biopolymer transport protein ExbB/TolQ
MHGMWIAYLVIIIFPLLLIGMVIFAIAKAAAQIYRNAKGSYTELKPYVADISAKSRRAQQLSSSFAARGDRLSKSLDELSGRWAFISGVIYDTQHSPVVKAANMAGKHFGGNKGKGKTG